MKFFSKKVLLKLTKSSLQTPVLAFVIFQRFPANTSLVFSKDMYAIHTLCINQLYFNKLFAIHTFVMARIKVKMCIYVYISLTTHSSLHTEVIRLRSKKIFHISELTFYVSAQLIHFFSTHTAHMYMQVCTIYIYTYACAFEIGQCCILHLECRTWLHKLAIKLTGNPLRATLLLQQQQQRMQSDAYKICFIKKKGT